VVELDRNYRGLRKYSSLLKTICMIEEYNELSEREWEGCLGIACVISIIEGVSINLQSIAYNLGMPFENVNLENAFERLKINGIFGGRRNIKYDPLLKGKGRDNKYMKGVERERNAWCDIAGVASGFIGMGEVIEK
jgi:hypothetical protein